MGKAHTKYKLVWLYDSVPIKSVSLDNRSGQ